MLAHDESRLTIIMGTKQTTEYKGTEENAMNTRIARTARTAKVTEGHARARKVA